MRTIRIGCGQGFWGDSLEAPFTLIQGERIDYLVLDYLAEVTMSILSKQRERDPQMGYAKDFVALVERLLPQLVTQKTKLIANAGGMNPRACAAALLAVVEKLGFKNQVKIGLVEGDDIFSSLGALQRSGEAFENMETGEPFSEVLPKIQSANVYLGADPIVRALQAGANIVVTGRVADPSLVLGPLVFEYGWAADDWNRRASGIVAGHIIECGAQCTGGNCSYDWSSIPSLETVGYPIVEVAEDGSFVVTKQKSSGGRVDSHSVKEQLLYEIGDPQSYVTPDVIADFTTIELQDEGKNRVRISGVQGRPRPEKLKVSMSYRAGFSATGTLLYAWPSALEKAKVAGEIVRSRLNAIGMLPARYYVEYVGLSACHNGLVPEPPPHSISSPQEILMRIAVHDKDKNIVERFTREVAPLVLNGPPGATAYSGGKQSVQEVFAYWPTLVSRSSAPAKTSVLT